MTTNNISTFDFNTLLTTACNLKKQECESKKPCDLEKESCNLEKQPKSKKEILMSQLVWGGKWNRIVPLKYTISGSINPEYTLFNKQNPKAIGHYPHTGCNCCPPGTVMMGGKYILLCICLDWLLSNTLL